MISSTTLRESSASSTDEAKVRGAVRAFLAADENAAALGQIKNRLGLNDAAIAHACVRYSLESMSSDNGIYDDAGTHVAMWIEYHTRGSMHAQRQAVVVQALQHGQCRSIADIGFGAPTMYLDRYVKATLGVSSGLYDKFPAAIDVARAILGDWDAPQFDKLHFAQHDMDVDDPIAACDAYLMLDAIEHAAEPQRYLRETVVAGADGALFLFHLPIGPLIASHHIAWGSAHEATSWLTACGLCVHRAEFILPNPDVDLFAQGHVSLRNLFVVARKR